MLLEKAEPFRSGRVSGIICGIALLWRLNCAGAHSAETGRFSWGGAIWGWVFMRDGAYSRTRRG